MTLYALDPRPLVNETVVSMLEDALERARAGDVNSCGLCLVYHDSATQAAWSRSDRMAALAGAAAMLSHRVTAAMVEETGP